MADVAVINVLGKDTYDDCHIKGSINVPVDEIEQYAQKLDKDTEIVLYCANYACTADTYAWEILKKMGFKNLWVYEGGITQWYQMGFPVEGACQNDYLKESYEKTTKPHAPGLKKITVSELKKLMSS